MKPFLYWVLFAGLCLHATSSYAQVPLRPSDYFNKVQDFLNEKANADSAFFYLRKMTAADKSGGMLPSLIHTVMAQEFIEPAGLSAAQVKEAARRRALNTAVLQKLNRTATAAEKKILHPFWLWKQSLEHKKEPARLQSLADEYLKTELKTGNLFPNGRGRYALLIWQQLLAQPSLKKTADQLFHTVYDTLKNNQLAADPQLSGTDKGIRACHRYLFAYMNNQLAAKSEKKMPWLRIAFDYSPDPMDNDNSYAYFYDMVFLYHGEQQTSFKSGYIDYILQQEDKPEHVLNILKDVSLAEPDFLPQLKTYYEKHPVNGKTFADYWKESINAIAKTAMPVSLKNMDNTSFDATAYKGKWLLMDFWGTWCSPCRAEHPALQKFYTNVIQKEADKIVFLTIACHDTPEKVNAYIAEKKYSFPVAMADETVEKNFEVDSYPSKILITPEGNYITIPFSSDWQAIVKAYCGL